MPPPYRPCASSGSSSTGAVTALIRSASWTSVGRRLPRRRSSGRRRPGRCRTPGALLRRPLRLGRLDLTVDLGDVAGRLGGLTFLVDGGPLLDDGAEPSRPRLLLQAVFTALRSP